MQTHYGLNYVFEVLILGLVLSIDSFSAAVSMGSRPFTLKDALRFAITSGGAEAIAAFIGAIAGAKIISQFEEIDHWIAFGLLAILSLHMAYEGMKDLLSKEKKIEEVKFHSFFKVLVISIATSMDAFGVGISLGISGKPIIHFIISIGLWAFITTILGLYLAKLMSKKLGPVMNIFGALVLGVLAFKMLSI
jgi:putative Mn2+ efflux pump MntP